jgi:hypothetical protein
VESDDESRSELDPQCLEPLPLDEPQQQVDGRAAHLGQRLANRRQIGGDDRRVLDVVEADDREILRDA